MNQVTTMPEKAEKHLQRSHETLYTKQVIIASQEKKISQENDIDIRKTLSYVCSLIGITANNMPDKTASMVLVGHLRNHLKKYSLSDIRIAFDLGISGQLDYPIKHFQNFSALFLENVMQSYNRYRVPIIKSQSMQLPEKKISAEEKQQIIIDGIIRFYKKFRLGKYSEIEFTDIKYDTLDTLGLISFTDERKRDFMLQGENVLILELQKRKDKSGRIEGKQIQEVISSIRDNNSSRIETIINRAKVIALKTLFTEMANMSVDLENLINEALTGIE